MTHAVDPDALLPTWSTTSVRAEVPALRTAVVRDPRNAVDWIRQQIVMVLGQDGRRVDLMILLAEALLRLGDPGARQTADAAVADAKRCAAHRLPAAQLVAVDVLASIGHPGAVAAYLEHVERLTGQHHGPGLDPAVVLAQAGYAVAVYQQSSCRAGHKMLTGLLQTVGGRQMPDSPLILALSTAAAAMREACDAAPGRLPAAGKLPPMPGGVLNPDPFCVPPHLFTARLHHHPGQHDRCARTRTGRTARPPAPRPSADAEATTAPGVHSEGQPT